MSFFVIYGHIITSFLSVFVICGQKIDSRHFLNIS